MDAILLLVYYDVMCNVWLWRSLVDWQDDVDRKEETLAIIADLLGFSWTGKLSTGKYWTNTGYIYRETYNIEPLDNIG